MMKTILFVAFVATILTTARVFASTDQLTEGKECAPGTTWKSQCNDCGCTGDGMHYCTRKGCEEEGEEKRCAPNSRWSVKCNICWCTDGSARCTLMACPDV